jgi:hypothetical protein
MQVIIEVAESDPPVGTVMLWPPSPDGTRPSEPFVGWLGLLRALSELLRPPGSPSE